MARIVELLSAHGENFQGMANSTVEFGKITKISGANATGKTTWLNLILWVCTNKDSNGNEKFEIRTLDESGNKVHQTDIVGELRWHISDDLGDRIMTLRKTQKEKWVKKRGAQEQEYAGNENIYQIDGYPTNESSYKAQIAENIASDLWFSVLTNAMFFSSMDWKERRKILLSMAMEQSDVEMAKRFGGYDLILEELEKAPGTDDVLKKYKTEKRELQKKQAEIPTRIDEVSLRKVDVDINGIASRKDEINSELAGVQQQLNDADEAEKKAAEEQQAAANKIKAMRTELARIADEVKADYLNQKRDLEFQIREKESELNQVDYQIRQEEAYQNHSVGEAKYYSDQVEQLKQNYLTVKKSKWDGQTFCPTCGQILPEAQVAKAQQNWQTHQLESLAKIGEDGKKAAAKRDEAKAKADEYGVNIAKLIDKRTELVSAKKALDVQLESLVEPSADDDEYKKLENVIHQREEDLKRMYFAPVADKDALNARKSELQRELVNLGVMEAQVAQDTEIDERIESLRAELKEVSQKVLHAEQMIDLTERFVSAKMNAISQEINSMFAGVRWKLWDGQINGGIRECCECTVDGVPYSSLNHGNQITAGVSIINALQAHKHISLPVFIDNAEALSSDNAPHVDGQLVLLSVTDSPVLTVEKIGG